MKQQDRLTWLASALHRAQLLLRAVKAAQAAGDSALVDRYTGQLRQLLTRLLQPPN